MRTQSRHIGRLIIRASLLLLLGAIVNLGVAWACVCWGLRPSRQSDEPTESAWKAPVPENWPPTALHWRASAIGITEFDAYGDAPQGKQTPIYLTAQWFLAAGLPCRALFLERHDEEFIGASSMGLASRWPTSFRQGIAIPRWVPWCGMNRYFRFLPTRPIWPGFAVNTVFYALILWLICGGPFALHRRLRARRGQCQNCGYPIGVSPVCTECGETVTAHAVTLSP